MRNYSVAFILVSLILMLSQNEAYSQTIFFDARGLVAADSAGAYYSRTFENGTFTWKYFNGNIYRMAKSVEVSDTDESQNKYVGEVKTFYRSGEIESVCYFDENGRVNGPYVEYYRNGKLKKECIYEDGTLAKGELSEYDVFSNKTKVFTDSFDDNSNNWYLHTDERSSVRIENGHFVINSNASSGISRFIEVPEVGLNYSYEIKLNVSELKSWSKAGMIFGFKDWKNYQFFVISRDRISIGRVHDGVYIYLKSNIYSAKIKKKEWNTLKILTQGERIYYALNGDVIEETEQRLVEGANFGMIVSFFSGDVLFDDFIYKKFETFPHLDEAPKDEVSEFKLSGHGIVMSQDGLILTTSDAVLGENDIQVVLNSDGESTEYSAELVASDSVNNLALLKIRDPDFVYLKPIPFSLKNYTEADHGKAVYTLNNKKKLVEFDKNYFATKGVIKFNEEMDLSENILRTSIPRELAVDGAPIFNSRGELVGISNLRYRPESKTVYGIANSSIYSILQKAPIAISVPKGIELQLKSDKEREMILSEWVTLIKVKK